MAFPMCPPLLDGHVFPTLRPDPTVCVGRVVFSDVVTGRRSVGHIPNFPCDLDGNTGGGVLERDVGVFPHGLI